MQDDKVILIRAAIREMIDELEIARRTTGSCCEQESIENAIDCADAMLTLCECIRRIF